MAPNFSSLGDALRLVAGLFIAGRDHRLTDVSGNVVREILA
jgi:hypothetical protein